MSAIKSFWARIGKKGRISVISVVCIIVIAVGAILFRIPHPPHVILPPEALVSVGGEVEHGQAVSGFPITNTMITAWITIIVLGLVAYFATRKMKLVPKGLQNIVEAMMETMINFVDSVAGEEKGRKFFPMFATIFLFVFANAWLALLPGFESIGLLETVHEGADPVLIPILRGANTDVNLPLAIALVSFVFVEYWGLRALGIRYLKKFVGLSTLFAAFGLIFRGKKAGFGMLMNGVIEAFVGFVEALSEMIRIVSFTFRLFGNMTAGHILLASMMFLIPWLVALPFYVLELFVGLVQALIFAGLTLVFVTMATTSHDEGHEAHAEHAGH